MLRSNYENKRKRISTVIQKQTLIYRETMITIITNFSSERVEARRQWNNILKSWKKNNYHLRILYSSTIFFKNWDEIKTFLKKANWENLMSVELHYKKHWRMFFRLKGIDIRWKLKSIGRKKIAPQNFFLKKEVKHKRLFFSHNFLTRQLTS